MKYIFTSDETERKLNIIEMEDLEFQCDFIEGEGLCYNAYGVAVVDREVYNNFQVEIVLEKEIEGKTAVDIINADWEDYEYIFPV